SRAGPVFEHPPAGGDSDFRAVATGSRVAAIPAGRVRHGTSRAPRVVDGARPVGYARDADRTHEAHPGRRAPDAVRQERQRLSIHNSPPLSVLPPPLGGGGRVGDGGASVAGPPQSILRPDLIPFAFDVRRLHTGSDQRIRSSHFAP